MMGEAHKLTPDESIVGGESRDPSRAGDRQVIVGVSHAGLENVRRLSHEVMVAGAVGRDGGAAAGPQGRRRRLQLLSPRSSRRSGRTFPSSTRTIRRATGVYLPPPVFERLVDDFRQLVMLKHEDAPGLAKLTRVREGEKKPGRRRVSILVGNGGLYLPQEMRRGADGAMTGFAWPEMLVQVYELFAAGKTEEAEDLFDIYLPLVRHELQPAIGLALRKEVLFRRGAIRSPQQRAPGSSLTATDRGELDGMIQRVERRLAGVGRSAQDRGGVGENGRLRSDRPQRQDRHRRPPDRRRHRRQGRQDRRHRAPSVKGTGTREIDAGGKFVLPGGIDSHCHIEQKSGMGVMCADDFYTGTVSAAFGGTTTVIPFAAQHRGMSLRQVVKDYHEAATPKAVIDYAFHLIVTDPSAAGAGPGAAGADQGRLHLVQDLHDLRRA